MIRYVDTLEGIEARQLRGFFEGWPNPPTPAMHRKRLADTVCDPQLQRFYSALGLRPATAMIMRNYQQSGRKTPSAG